MADAQTFEWGMEHAGGEAAGLRTLCGHAHKTLDAAVGCFEAEICRIAQRTSHRSDRHGLLSHRMDSARIYRLQAIRLSEVAVVCVPLCTREES